MTYLGLQALEILTDKREAFAMRAVMEKSGLLQLQLDSIREIERVGQRADPAQALLIKTLTELHESDAALSATERVEEDSLVAELRSIHRQRRRLLPVPDRVYPVSSAGALPGMDVLIDRMKTMVQDTKIFSSMDEQIPAFYTKVRRLVRAKRAELDCQFMHATDYLAMMSAELGLTETEVDGATRFLHPAPRHLLLCDHICTPLCRLPRRRCCRVLCCILCYRLLCCPLHCRLFCCR